MRLDSVCFVCLVCLVCFVCLVRQNRLKRPKRLRRPSQRSLQAIMSTASRPWASVVIPVKDERDNLPPLTEQLLKVLGSQEESRTAPFEIWYIDDGSTDGSGPLLDKLAAQHPEVRVLHFDRNYGKTAALDAGFRHTTGEIVVELDGDLQNDPADIP